MFSKRKFIIFFSILVLSVLIWCYRSEILSFFGGVPVTKTISSISKDDENENIEKSTPISVSDSSGDQIIVKETDSLSNLLVLNSVKDLKDLRNPFQNLARIKKEDGEESKEETSLTSIVNKTIEQNLVTNKEHKDDEITYQDLYDLSSGEKITEEITEPVIVEPIIEYPAFLLQGIVLQSKRKLAILTMEGQSYIISEGNFLQEWLIETINKEHIMVVNSEGQRFIISLEGVIIDEDEN